MGNVKSTPLFRASQEGDLSAVRVAVQDQPSSIDMAEEQMGWTALHVAAFNGYDAVVRELLARGAKTDVQDKEGRVPLHLSAQQGYAEVVKALLRARARTDVKDKYGRTPYDVVADRFPAVQALLFDANLANLSGGGQSSGPASPGGRTAGAPAGRSNNPADLLAAATGALGALGFDIVKPKKESNPGFTVATDAPDSGQVDATAWAAPKPSYQVVDGDKDGGWAAQPATGWGGEQDPTKGLNPIQSARYQLQKLGAGLAQQLQAALQPEGRPAQYTGAPGKVYKYEDVYRAANNFAPNYKISTGGFGDVYRGSLEGTAVAIKVLDASNGIALNQHQFSVEANMLARLHHPNIQMVLGCCPEQNIIVYELLDGARSLQERLFNNSAPPLAWRDRVRIATEVASALLFLHSAPEPVLHMDLKPANILLDRRQTAKLSDVGLSRFIGPSPGAPGGPPHPGHGPGAVSIKDPEFMRTGNYTPRSDVYALGMVMLEMLTGRDSAGLADVVEVTRKAARTEPMRFINIIDKRAGNWPAAEAAAFADLALHCVQPKRQDRPDLKTELIPVLVQLQQRTSLYPQTPAPSSSGLPSRSTDNAEPPQMFICPITQEVMSNPVFAADGFTYEAAAIAEWISRQQRSPLTNLPLANLSLVPNNALRSAIKEWRDQQRQGAAHGAGARPAAVGGLVIGGGW